MLHVTNGDEALPALRAAGVEGDLLPWRDVLHDGPVPTGLGHAELRAVRARFLARNGGASPDEVLRDFETRDARLARAAGTGEAVTLWFEADLFDVLQLLQVLDRLPDDGPYSLVLIGQDEFRGVSEVAPGELAVLGRAASGVGPQEHALARSAWAAFTSPEPAGLREFARGTPGVPAVGEALHRLLQEYPSVGDGLSRTERQLLEAVGAGARTRDAAFQEASRAEERPFLGDASAWAVLDRLAPLLDGDGLSDRGREVLAGRETWIRREERWIGGVRLPPGPPPWRWNLGSETVV